MTGPGDSLAHLIRVWLGSGSPDEARDRGHRVSCEQGRLVVVFGVDSGGAIMKRVEDTIFSIRDLPARRRIDGWMAGAANMNCPDVDRLRDSPTRRCPRGCQAVAHCVLPERVL